MQPVLESIEQRHRALADELGIGVSAELEAYFALLRQMASGIALMSEISDRTRARVLATGELMATELGARFLNTQRHRGLLVGCALRAEGAAARRRHRRAPASCRRPVTLRPTRRCSASSRRAPAWS